MTTSDSEHERATRNAISGQIQGTSVQAGTVLGGVHVHAADEPVPVIPQQLPPAPRLFAGRESELEALSGAVDSGENAAATVAISAIGGMGGIGKTCLALHWAHRNRYRFPDGQLYVNLRGFDPSGKPLESAVAVRGFLDGLHVAPSVIPTDLDAQAALYRSLVAGTRTLIVLDNARDADQVVPLLPGSATCTVLVTSRRTLTGLATAHGARLLRLDVLTEEDAMWLLAANFGWGRVTAEPDAVRELISLCGRLPLALSIVGARATVQPEFPVGEFVVELREAKHRLDALGDDDLRADLRAVFDWSYRTLDASEARLFRLFAVFTSADISRAAAASLAALPVARTRALLRNLVSANLVENYVPGRFRMHDLVRLFADEKATGATEVDEGDAARRRYIDFYLHTAVTAARVLDRRRRKVEMVPPAPGCVPLSFSDRNTAMAWLVAEHASLLATGRLAASHDCHSSMWNLAFALDTFHWRRGHVHDHVAVWRDGLTAAQRLGDLGMEGNAHRYLGFALARVGEHDDAIVHLHRALAISTELDDVREQARVYQDLSQAWELQEDFQQALQHVLRAYGLFQRVDSPVWQARALNLAARYQVRLGEHDQAFRACEKSLALSREHGDRDGEAASLDCLGDICLRLGRHVEAVAHYRLAHALRQELGNDYGAAESCEGVGKALLALGDEAEGAAVLRKAHQLYSSQNRIVEMAAIEQLLANLQS